MSSEELHIVITPGSPVVETSTWVPLTDSLENGPRAGSRRKSREMWARTTSTGSFVMTNPLALLDTGGNLTETADIDPVERETFGKLSLEDQIKGLLVRSQSEERRLGSRSRTGTLADVTGGSSSDLSILGSSEDLSGSRDFGEDPFDEAVIEEERLKGGMSRQASQTSVSAATGAVREPSRSFTGGSSASSAAKATIRASAVKNYKKLLAESSFNGDQPSSRMAPTPAATDDKRRLSVMPQASWTVLKGFRQAAEDKQLLDPVERTKINGKNVVFSGTVSALIAVFMGVEEVDTEYLQEFLFTYRFFMESVDLLVHLIHRHWYNDPKDEQSETAKKSSRQSQIIESQQDLEEWSHFRRLRVINFIRKWLQYHPHDFPKGTDVEIALQKFIANNLDSEKEGKYVQSLLAILDKGLRPGMIPRPIAQQTFDAKLDPKERMKLNGVAFVQFKPESMAEQLTLLEWQFFADIQEAELFDQIADSDEAAGERLLRMAKWIEKMHLWIATEVCMASNLKDRVSVIKRSAFFLFFV